MPEMNFPCFFVVANDPLR